MAVTDLVPSRGSDTDAAEVSGAVTDGVLRATWNGGGGGAGEPAPARQVTRCAARVNTVAGMRGCRTAAGGR